MPRATVVIAGLCMLVGQCATPSGVQEGEPAPNFAVRFDHKGCHYEYLDLFKGTYSQIGFSMPVPISLTPQQRYNLFRDIVDSGFFTLPSKQFGKVTDSSDVYELEARNGEQYNRVAWTITWVIQTKEGKPILELLEGIDDLLRHHPDVPKTGDGCNGGPPAVR